MFVAYDRGNRISGYTVELYFGFTLEKIMELEELTLANIAHHKQRDLRPSLCLNHQNN